MPGSDTVMCGCVDVLLLDVVRLARLEARRSNGLRDVGAELGVEVGEEVKAEEVKVEEGLAKEASVLVSMYAIACSIAQAHSRTSLSLLQQEVHMYDDCSEHNYE